MALQTTGLITATGGRQFRMESGLLWLDHQWGSIGISTDKLNAAYDFAAYSAGININPVNMGFGVPGTENWFGLHLRHPNGSHWGSYCATRVSYRMWNKRVTAGGIAEVGQWQLADGTQYTVNYSYIVISNLTTDDSSVYATGFRFDKVEGTDGRGMPSRFDVFSVADDSRTRWASGGYLFEGAVEVWQITTGGRQLIGHGWTEAVGWDRQAIRSVVSTATRQHSPSQESVDVLSSRAPWSKPPPL